MLILARQVGQSVVVGNNVTVTVLEVRGNQIRLGFDGPREVPIHRQEIQNDIATNGPQRQSP